ncbi:SDR family NAD(P)-dependent oxidoreductase [uncultured Chitinophaga sp.]|jgi:Short-chain dehydrogenase involved in D-alanine esterification of lipoteichoic acid and wall teichoic acid (D-alanine transfer protein)|uniref:SDR family oxidoreductase n=1 Tax=uncultured Chitinophaga sp. TaxID=339340 RepID=UPI002622354C|nr:SDR family NAD(P)-dependent oxidoreductase [uncultured Chitinophaga sp.]
MNIQNKKVLVTGGGSGIGFSIAKAFADKGNQVIIFGRTEDRLKGAVAKLPNASYVVGDVTNEKDVLALVKQVKENYGGIDILVNNAGTGRPQPLDGSDNIIESARYEIELNYLSVVRLTSLLLPALKASKEAAIINIQSIVSYVPSTYLATYSASKAALHSYSQSLRLVLQQSAPQVKVFEVFPPYVDTDLTKNLEASKLSPEEVSSDLIQALESDSFAIRNGITKDIYQLFRQSPEEALLALNAK